MKKLLDFIGKCETGRTDKFAYDTIIGHHEDKLPKPLTEHTVGEVLALQSRLPKMYPKLNSSACGKYQIIRPTLSALVKALEIPLNAPFGPTLQDRLGLELAERRGLNKYLTNGITLNTFALGLSKEWASLPVLFETEGKFKPLKRGDGYYDGDGVNGPTVTADAFEKVLRSLREPDVPEVPVEPKGARVNWWVWLIVGLIVVGLLIGLRKVWGL